MTEPLQAEPLQIVHVNVDLIDPNPWNPNQQSETVARATRESLERYGFVEPVLLRPHPDIPGRFQIVNGEHRWGQAGGLGYEQIPAVIKDLTDDEAKKLTIVLNETTGDADVVLLGQLLAGIAHLDDFKIALPYTDAELDHLLAIGAADDWDQYGRGGGSGADPPPVDPVEHEIVLAMTSGQHDLFRGWLRILEKEFGTADVTEIVFEAVRRAALDVNQGAPRIEGL